MSKPYVFFCYDTEDTIHPEADEALGRLARLYTDAGVRACFFLVAEKARVLRARGRRDVLDLLREHEIDYHGNYWFEYPEPALVYGNRDTWDVAVSKARTIETPGLQDIAEITGRFPVATVQHQNNHSPATTHAMQQAGVQVWNGGLGGELEGAGWVMNLLTLCRNGCSTSSQGSWGDFQFDPDEPQCLPEPMDAATELNAFQRHFDTLLESGRNHINILGHPTCWAMAEWWGWYEWPLPFRCAGQNGGAGSYAHGRQWRRVPLRSPQDRDAHFRWTAEAARWLAARNDIQLATFGDALEDHREERGIWLGSDAIVALGREISAKFAAAGEFDWCRIGNTTLSAADALYLLSQYLEFMLEQEKRPTALQIRRTLGPVEEVYRASMTLQFKRADLLLAARQVVHYVDAHGRLPHAVRAHSIDFGPGELLIAMAQALSGERLPENFTLEPTQGLPRSATLPFFAEAKAGSTNAPPAYESDQIHRQGLLQSWSYRPAIRR